MDANVPNASPSVKRRGIGRWPIVVGIALLGMFAVLVIALLSVVPFRSATARDKVVAVLAARLDSEVELGSLRLRVLPRLRAEGEGLVIRHKGRRDVPPLISVRSFSVEGSVRSLLRRHVSLVTLEGLEIQIPPRDRNKPDEGGSRKLGALPKGYVIDSLVTSGATLTFIPRQENKKPKVWAIHDLHMSAVAFDGAMPFEATLTNAVPPGEITTHGTFGPWASGDPGETPLDGAFVFDNADLGVFKGISGILSAKGTFGGRLEQIDVHGETTTPEFALTSVGHPIPLHAKYHTIVDGTNGDTILERIDASFLKTSLVAKGDVIDMPGKPGRRVALDVTMEPAQLEDVLWLAVKSPAPPMTGALTLTTKLEIPPGPVDVVEKLLLEGKFQIASTRFTNADVQRKIEELSKRGSGKVTEASAPRVTSDFAGSFKLADGTLRIPTVAFDVPGAIVRLSGTYGMRSERIDFKGTLFLDAKISETVTGFKSVLLKALDPLFKGEKGGSAIPIQISGNRGNPSFGLDKARLFKRD
jgi:AsmA-like protein